MRGELPILFQDDWLAVVAKPAGVLVHPSSQASDRFTCLSWLRNQLGRWVYPIHRLDRGTSGVVLFALDSETAAALNLAFRERRVAKGYLALVRGHLDTQEGTQELEHEVPDGRSGERKLATTRYRALQQTEQPFAIGPYARSRYTWMELCPLTGYYHQLRRHMRHLRHPIIGDARYGDRDHNRFFAAELGFDRMALHCGRLALDHPVSGAPLEVRSPLPNEFQDMLVRLGMDPRCC